MQVCTSEEEWKKIAAKFHSRWNFPRCCGALDGKHIKIKRPNRSGAYFYNYKGFYSIVLLALVDADYCFTYIDVGANGRAADASVFRFSSLGTALATNSINLPPGHVIVGDDAFPLTRYLMKRYPISSQGVKKRIFNYRQSRARNIVENAFGILASRFRIFLKTLEVKPSTADKVVWASCSLHNWLRKTSKKTYTPTGYVDQDDLSSSTIIPGMWRSVTQGLESTARQGTTNFTRGAESVRNEFATYFCKEGAVPWQWKKIDLQVDEDYDYNSEEENVDDDLLGQDELNAE